MKNIKFRSLYILFGLMAWGFLFAGLSLFKIYQFNILNIVGFSFLIFVPGYLTSSLIVLDKIDRFGKLSIIVAISLLELMVMTLLGNALFPLLHITRPLDQVPLLMQLSVMFIVLLIPNLYVRKNQYFSIGINAIRIKLQDLIFLFSPLIFVILSILGSTYLNNGGTGIITLCMLIGIAIYLGLLLWRSHILGENVLPFALFFISLSLLLMTSLRGWYVVGHDIQREFRLFQLAKSDGVWNISRFKDAYNACVSITILPTLFSNLLNLSDPYIFKILFQIIFSLVPSIVYLTIKRFTSVSIALISTIYFISFPTFFGDMPFLNRQEIAFVFLMLMVYVIFQENISIKKRQTIFCGFGVGMILSHYSTTYTFLALMIFLVIALPFAKFFGKFLFRLSMFKNSGIELDNSKHVNRITFGMFLLLTVVTFMWSAVMTNTAKGSIGKVISATIVAIRNRSFESMRSSTVGYSLFSSHQTDPQLLFEEYKKDVVEKTRFLANEGTYYDESTYNQYPLKVTNPNYMPVSPFGHQLQSIGIDVVHLNILVRQYSAKIIQVLLLFGIIVVVFKKDKLKRKIDLDFFMLVLASVIFVAAQVVLPVLSTEYGILRAFIQSIIFFGLFISIGSMELLYRARYIFKIIFGSFLALFFFLSSTGVFAQILGGYGAQLHMNNSGYYYGVYFIRQEELFGINWLTNQFPRNETPHYQTDVQTSRHLPIKADVISDTNPINDVYPGLVRKSSYVFLGELNTVESTGSFSYLDTGVFYTYPMQFLNNQKNLIYNNGISRVYK